ncbi:MAG: F0F1 ATP synthase subunit epsilon [Methylovirgula sp.]
MSCRESRGEFTVLKDHAPTLALMKPGILEYDLSTTQKTKLFVRGGFAQIAPEGLTILASRQSPSKNSMLPSSMPISRTRKKMSPTQRRTRRAVAPLSAAIRSVS